MKRPAWSPIWKKLFLSSFVSLAGLIALPASAATPDELVAQGRVFLANSNLTSAHARFESALENSPGHGPANVLAATTRLLLLSQRPGVSNFLTRLGVNRNGRNLFDWTADFTEDADGNVVLPSTLNSSEAVTLIRSEVMPGIRASLTNLSRVTDTAFLLDLTAEETHVEATTLDYGDVQLLRALLRASLAFGHTLGAHNLSLNISRLRQLAGEDQLTIGRLLKDNPSLFGAGAAGDLASSRDELLLAAGHYTDASEFIRQRPPDTVRLFTLDPEEVEDEAQFRDNLDAALASLDEPVKLNPEDDYYVYLGSYFDGVGTLRSLLPKFDGDQYLPGTLPDYTFGGMFVGLSPSRVEEELLQLFGAPYQGFYASYPGSSMPVAAFVRSNNVATILGFAEQPFLLQVQLDSSGYGEIDRDGLYAFVEFYSDGFYGEWNDFDHGVFSYFDGEKVAAGSTVNEAGYYEGTLSPSSAGKPRAILTPDARLFFVVLDSDNQASDAGVATLEEDGSFSANTYADVILNGTLNRSTKVLSGTFDDGVSPGTFTLSRKGFLPEASPPVIVSQPQSLTVEAGKSVTLSVTASGAPLQYQWLSNDIPVWRATGSTFTRKVPGPAHIEIYSVAVFNPRGAVTSQVATVTVLNESEPPKVSIVSPAALARLPAAETTVTGTASDNAAVTSVLYRVNDGEWTAASGTTNWTALVSLEPCTNLFEVKAVDSGGNESTVASRSFVRVVNTPLVLTKNGEGQVTPDLSGQNLEQCKTYEVTAVPSPGNIFSNWSGGFSSGSAALKFVMTPGLELQANFVPNPFPSVQGIYNGLFREGDQVRHDHAGGFTATTTAGGAYSGKLTHAGRKISFKGQFDAGGRATNSVTSGTNILRMAMQLELSPNGSGRITGTVVSSDSSWTAELEADRAYFHRLRPTDLDGAYTLVIPGADEDALAPGGDGVATITVTTAGAVTVAGTLAEGTKFSQKTTLSQNGEWSLFAPLHAGKGSILGRMAIDGTGTSLSGELTWTRPGVPKNPFYTNGFVLATEAIGSAYLRPGTNRVLNFSAATLNLAGGNLGQSFSNHVALTLANKVLNESSNKITMTLNVTKGLFSGTFMETGSVRTVKFSGAVLQDRDSGHGSFLGTNRVGRVFFGPREP